MVIGKSETGRQMGGKALARTVLAAVAAGIFCLRAQDMPDSLSGADVRQLVVYWLDAGGTGDRQMAALVKLSILRNRGMLRNLPRKKEIFEILSRNSGNARFLYESARVLASMGKDEGLLRQCEATLRSGKAGRRDSACCCTCRNR